MDVMALLLIIEVNFSLGFDITHHQTNKMYNVHDPTAQIFHLQYINNCGPLKSKHFEKNYMVIILLGCLTILAFEISKKDELLLTNRHSVSSTYTATLEI